MCIKAYAGITTGILYVKRVRRNATPIRIYKIVRLPAPGFLMDIPDKVCYYLFMSFLRKGAGYALY